MTNWLHRRSTRERAVLAGAGVAAVLMVSWAYVLQPAAARTVALQSRIAAQQETLRQLAEARALKAAAPRSVAGGGASLASAVEKGLRDAGLAAAIRRIEPAGEGMVSVLLEQASFDAVVGWLATAGAEDGITVVELSADRADAEGAVGLRMRLARAASPDLAGRPRAAGHGTAPST